MSPYDEQPNDKIARYRRAIGALLGIIDTLIGPSAKLLKLNRKDTLEVLLGDGQYIIQGAESLINEGLPTTNEKD